MLLLVQGRRQTRHPHRFNRASLHESTQTNGAPKCASGGSRCKLISRVEYGAELALHGGVVRSARLMLGSGAGHHLHHRFADVAGRTVNRTRILNWAIQLMGTYEFPSLGKIDAFNAQIVFC